MCDGWITHLCVCVCELQTFTLVTEGNEQQRLIDLLQLGPHTDGENVHFHSSAVLLCRSLNEAVCCRLKSLICPVQVGSILLRRFQNTLNELITKEIDFPEPRRLMSVTHPRAGVVCVSSIIQSSAVR